MKKLITILMAMVISIALTAQSISPEVVASAGDYYENGNGSLSWTLGEIATETYSNGSVILTQGFQQSTYSITFIEEKQNNDFNISVYPNPTSDYINIEFDIKNKSDVLIQLCDINGRILLNETINSTENNKQYDFNIFSTGMYFLRISSEKDNYSETYKIQKK